MENNFKQNKMQIIKRISAFLLLSLFMLCLFFQYLRFNPAFKQKMSLSMSIFANNFASYNENNSFLRNTTYHISNFILNISTVINPDEAFGYEVLGYNYYKLAKYSYNPVHKKNMIKKSFENYQKSLTYYPNSPQLLNHLGFNYMEIEDFNNALKMFEKTLTVDKKNKVAMQQIPYIQSSFLKNYQEALKNIEIYMKEYPNDIDSLFAKAWILSALNRHKEAITNYKKYLEHNPDSVAALVNITGCENQIQDYKNALNHVEKGLKLNPYSIYLLSHKVDILANLGRYKEAKDIIMQVLDWQIFYGKHFFYFKLAKIQKIEGDRANSDINFKKSKDIVQDFFDRYCSQKDYDINDSDAKCYNTSVFLKHFEKNKNEKRFIWYFY